MPNPITKPSPIPHVYDWNDLYTWMQATAPGVASELSRMILRGRASNDYFEVIRLSDHEEGRNEGLSPDSIAWLRENIAPEFYLHVSW